MEKQVRRQEKLERIGFWKNRAGEYFRIARRKPEGRRLGSYGMMSHHAAEFALKGALIAKEKTLPRTENIARLIKELEKAGVKIDDDVKRADLLSNYTIAAHYIKLTSGKKDEVSEDEYKEILSCAEAALRCGEQIMTAVE